MTESLNDLAELGQLISGKTDWALWLNDHSIATQNMSADPLASVLFIFMY